MGQRAGKHAWEICFCGEIELINWLECFFLCQPFLHLIKLTRVQEGIIVRCIQRIDELLKELMAAANLIGDVELAGKIAEASKCIRRDIVFSVSLYIQDTIAIKE